MRAKIASYACFTTQDRVHSNIKKRRRMERSQKVGSLIDDVKYVERRKQLTTAVLNKLYNIWIKGRKLKTSTKIQLYKSLKKSILLYNCGAWAPTRPEEERLNAHHRKHLKKTLSIRYPKKLTKKYLYII